MKKPVNKILLLGFFLFLVVINKNYVFAKEETVSSSNDSILTDSGIDLNKSILKSVDSSDNNKDVDSSDNNKDVSEEKKSDVSANMDNEKLLTTNKTNTLSSKIGNSNNIEEYSLNEDGTGIVANSIGVTADEISQLNDNGDIDGIKNLIITKSNAIAYGLSGNNILDITSQIQISSLDGLEEVSPSSDLQKFTIVLSIPKNISGTDKDLTSEIIVYVGTIVTASNWTEFSNAILNGTSTIVDVQNSFTSTDTSRGDGIRIPNNRPEFVVLGNGHSIDFLNISLYYATNANLVYKISIDNLSMYGGNFYGPITIRDYSKYGSQMTYRHVNYNGAQITAAFAAIIRFEGKNNIVSEDTQYTSYDGTVRSMRNTQQSGLESHTIVFGKNTDTSITTANGDAVILGSWYSNASTVSGVQPSLTMEEGAQSTLRTLGSEGETNSWQCDGGNIYSVISLQRNGKIQLGKNSQLKIETASTSNRVPIRIGYSRSVSWNPSITLDDHSSLTINSESPVSTPRAEAALMMQNNATIDIKNSAKFIMNLNNMTSGLPATSLGTNSNINISENGIFNINKQNGVGGLLNLSSGSKFYVESQGTAEFQTSGEGNSTSTLIDGGTNSDFTIGDKGNFITKVKDGTGNRIMLNFARGAKFQFSNANKVDLDSRGNTNTTLINMVNPGLFKADIQAVSAWAKADSANEDPTFNWTPMYGMEITYNGTNTSKIVANSVTDKIKDDFINNFKTVNFSRVLFDYIPDVVIGFNPPSDNRSISSGQKLTGIVNNNSLMLFYKVVDENDSSKDILLTQPTVNSPFEGDDRKFNTVADSSGKFSFTLPEDVTLEAGEKIRAYAWCNGKDNSVIQTVLDKTPPTGDSVEYQSALNEPVPNPSVFVKNPKDTNPKDQNFTYAFNSETPKSEIENYMKKVGEYTIKIDLSDEAGNTSVITSKLIVNPTSRYISGSDLEISYNDVKDMTVDFLKNYILTESNPSAYTVVDGIKRELSDEVIVSDLGGMENNNSLQAINYTVTLSVPADKTGTSEILSTTITVKVTDDNPPTAKSKVTPIELGNSSAITGESVDLKNFLNELSDNDTPNEEIVATLEPNQNIDELVKSVGPKDIKIKIADKSGNFSIVTTQVFIYDDTWVVTEKGAVTGLNYNIAINEFDISDGRNITISEGNVKAYDISGEKAINVTADSTKLKIDLSKIGDEIDTPYPIKLTVNDAEKTIQITLNKPNITIVDPDDGITEFTPIDPETNEPIDPNSAKDLLKIQYTSGFDFGTTKRNLISNEQILSNGDIGIPDNQEAKKVPAFVSIADQRKDSTGWELSVSSNDFINNNDGTTVLKGAYMTLSDAKYNGDFEDKPIVETNKLEVSEAMNLISASQPGTNGTWSLSLGDLTKEGKSTGVNLTVPKNAAINLGDYSTNIIWTLKPKLK